jgi:hypothetical protein
MSSLDSRKDLTNRMTGPAGSSKGGRSLSLRSCGRKQGRHWRALAVLGVGAITLAACSSGPSSSGSGTTTTSTPAGRFSGTTTSVSVPAYDASHNARQDVVAGSCTGNSSTGYTLKGTIQNSSTSSRKYSIAVDFVTKSGDTVMATRVLNVGPVAPHASTNWSTPAAGQGQPNLTCVIRQALWS